MITRLPIYLQKYIIKILCTHIDYYNSLVQTNNVFSDYRKDEQEIKKLMITVALVSREWFKTLSDNLVISVDFNFKEKGKDQYSIIKSENVETLKLHFDHDDQRFYQIDSDFRPIEIPIEIVNEKLMKLSMMEQTNFKYLYLRNVNNDFELNILDKIYQCKQTNDQSVTLCQFSLSPYVDLVKINHLKKIVSKIFTLLIYETPKIQVLIETFKQWSNTIEYFFVHYSKRSFSIIDTLSSYNDGYGDASGSGIGIGSGSGSGSGGGSGSGTKINYLSNLILCDYSPISINEIETLIKSSPKLKFLSIGICLNSFLFYLSNETNQNENQKKQFSEYYSQIDCSCNVLCFNESIEGNLMTKDEKSIKFNNHFSNINKYLNENENTINQLRIYNYCSFNNQIPILKQFLKAPNFLIGKLVSFISSFKSLKILEVYFFNEQLFNEIIFKNPNITHYRITVSDETISKNDALKYSTEILSKNSHIIEFRIN
ncbi:hypothetical protein ACTFIT_012023 [Dictyostelium discoideum]